MRSNDRKRPAFTLIEVLLVVLIIGMLAGVFIVGYAGVQGRAKIDTTRNKLKASIASAVELFNLHIGHYPTEEEGGLQALRTKPTFTDEKLAEKWAGPYLTEDPVDEWGQPFNYQPLDAATAAEVGVPFKLWSNGPDKQDGTEDDIRNWTEQR
jgi:general secretion pathway protein G